MSETFSLFLSIIRLLRPQEWIKNTFVFAPLVFSGSFQRSEDFFTVLTASIFFCVASSAAYVMNDLKDLDLDSLHPEKRLSRPLASRTVSINQARFLLIGLYAILLIGLIIHSKYMGIVFIYLILNVAYSFKLKEWPIVDLFCIATGFILRVLTGAMAISVQLSTWTLITTLCLALYLAVIKRRQELINSGSVSRNVLKSYTKDLMDHYAQMAGTSAMVFYGFFAVTIRPALVHTIPLVMFGIFRYWYIVERVSSVESPTEVFFTDIPLIATVLTWFSLCLYVLWI